MASGVAVAEHAAHAVAQVEDLLPARLALDRLHAGGNVEEEVAVEVPSPVEVHGPPAARELQTFTRTRLSQHEYPRLVEFVAELPKTPSGKILRRALKEGVDLRDVALYHLVTMAKEYVPLSMSMAAAELQKVGLERHDAAVIAVLLADQNSASSAMGLRKVRGLLASAQLNEANQAALSMPDDFPHREDAIKEVKAARGRLAAAR